MATPSDASAAPSAAEIDAIASKKFPNSFRGWDPDAVRVHLVSVAETVRALQQRESDLARRLVEAEAAAKRADLTQLDPDEVDRILGEETARVLRTARESAAEMVERATEQAALLARQAADDANAARETSLRQSQQMLADAAEEAVAIRQAGQQLVDDLKAAAEAEIEERRAALEVEFAEARESLREEGAQLTAEAEDAAAAIRRAADDEVAERRAEVDRHVEHQKIALERELAERRAAVTAELDEMVEATRTQVDEAERMRERVLADLARRRKAARQHLEQLQAGRERLLAAYEVIKATTDAATDELSVVLIEAKRVADEASRRVEEEPTPSAEEMLAELDLARMADLPIIAPSPATPSSVVTVDDQPGSVIESDGSDVVEVPSESSGLAPGNDESSDDPIVEDDGGDDSEDDVVSSHAAIEKRPSRRVKRKVRGVLGGEELPDIPMEPIEGSAEFEQVRVVVESDPVEQPRVSDGRGELEPAGAIEDGDVAPRPTSTSGAERALATVANDRSKRVQPAGKSPVDQADGGSIDDEVTDIFARLRAGQRDANDARDDSSADDVAPVPAVTSPSPSGEHRDEHQGEEVPTPGDEAGNSNSRVDADPSENSLKIAGLFERRDAAVDDVARRLAKHVKRRLSDHQSELLDELRRSNRKLPADKLVGSLDEFRVEWASIAEEDLAGAVAAGRLMAEDVSEQATVRHDVDLGPVIDELVDMIARPLHARLLRVLTDGGEPDGPDDDGNVQATDGRELADSVRACYREWRGARLTEAAADASARAFGEGLLGALGDGVAVEWCCGPGEQPCSDCNDNRLAGDVAAGHDFPTGQPCAPAHPGCRCLVLPTSR